MKKLVILLIAIIFSNIITAQHKMGEEVIWSENFTDGLPDGWEIVDLTENEMPWLWANDTIDGVLTQNAWINSESPETGYMAMPMDGYNSYPQFTHMTDGGITASQVYDVDSYFQTSAIDLTNQNSCVILQFHMQYRTLYENRFDVEISNDFDPENPELAHWQSHKANIYIGSGDPAWDGIHQIWLSQEYINSGLIGIRFHAYSGYRYYWNIDDIKILKTDINNDVEIMQTWNFYSWMSQYEIPQLDYIYVEHGGGYYEIPKSQVQPFIGFWSEVKNNGYEQQNTMLNTTVNYSFSSNEELTTINTFQSEPISIGSYLSDTLKINDLNYLPEEHGYYHFNHEIVIDSIDGIPENNIDYYPFIVSDSIYSRTSNVLTGTISTKRWDNGGVDGDKIGVFFEIIELVELEAMKWYFHEKNRDFAEQINAGYFTYVCKLYNYNSEENEVEPNPIVTSLEYTIELSDTGKWITTPFEKNGYSELIEPGEYILAIETNTVEGSSNYNNPIQFYIGTDESIPQSKYVYNFFSNINNEWNGGFGNDIPSIKMIIAAENWTGNDGVSVDEVKNELQKELLLSQNYPNPATGKTEIKYRISKRAKVRFEVFDISGIQILEKNEGTQTKGNHNIDLDVSNLESGIYYYTLKAGDFKQTKKMVVIK